MDGRAAAGSTRARIALGASIVSFVFVALVASVPGSPFTPVLPSAPSGPFTWLAGLIRLDEVHGDALAAVGVVAAVGAVIAFLLVVLAARRGWLSPRIAIVLAITYHVALLFLPLMFSRDVYSYAYYGKIASTYHANPYIATPADFPNDVLAGFVGPKWIDTPAVYGPLWTQASAVVTRVFDDVGSLIATFRLIAITASFGTVLVVARLVRRVRPEYEAFAIVLVGLNPTVLFQSAASGHNDLLLALAVASAIALVFSRRERWATFALALGALVKVTAALPLLLLWIAVIARRPRGERVAALVPHVAIAGVLALVAAAPFANADDPSLGAVELASHEGWLAPSRLFRRLFDAISGNELGWIPRLVFATIFVAAIVLIARAVWRRAPRISPPLVGASWGWGLLCLVLLGPVLLPWYVAWVLPLGWLLPSVPQAVLVATAQALTLSQWTAEPGSFPEAYDANLFFGHYVLTPLMTLLLVWLLVDLWRRSRADAPLEDEPGEVSGDRRERGHRERARRVAQRDAERIQGDGDDDQQRRADRGSGRHGGDRVVQPDPRPAVADDP